MKQFNFKYPWTDKEWWTVPDDEEMMQGQFPILDEQIDYVLEAVQYNSDHELDDRRRTCVQAGGAFGMYPLRLADHFIKVWTFEPLTANLQCMAMNLGVKHNVTVSPTALWHEETRLYMEYSKAVKNSYGAHHVSKNSNKGGEQVEGEPLDLYQLKDVDLIWLDVEGAELYALKGAEYTIQRCRPVVVIEERYLPQLGKLGVNPQSASIWLQEHGYKFFGRTHGDSVYVPR